MRSWIVPSLCAVTLFVLTGMLIGQQQGPLGSPGSTVAKPRKSADPDKKEEPAELPKIPSQYKRDKQEPTPSATFTTNVDIVTLDVAVMDNKGHFIPGIPPGNFRVLEDNVPQRVQAVTAGEARDCSGSGPRLCPRCRTGPMVVIAVLLPCHGPVPLRVDTS